MNWEELEKKHQKQWEEFEKLKIEAWQKLIDNENAMFEAFGKTPDKVPNTVFERIDKDTAEWHKQWSSNGKKAKELKDIQRIERETLKENTKQGILDQIRQAKEINRLKSKDRERDE